MHPAVAVLRLEEKGLVLGALLARMPPEAVARRFGGAAGARCRGALEAVGGETRSGRASALAALIALIRAPVPAGIERVHPDWLHERMAPEPSDIIRAIAAGLPLEVRRVANEILSGRGEDPKALVPTLGAVAVTTLRRTVFAGLVPIAGSGVPVASQVQSLLALSFAALEEAIATRGAETLGTSLQGAPAPVVARAAASLGGRLARVVLDAAARTGPAEAREAARRLVAAAVENSAATDPAWELGARALAAELTPEGEGALAAIAQRLPLQRGRRWLAYAREPIG